MDKRKVRPIAIAVLATVSLLGANRALAQNSASQPMRQNTGPSASGRSDESQALSDRDIQLLRKDLRSQKKQIVAANMDLTDAEAEKFWPVYDRYTADLTKINDTKTELIKQYLQNFNAMNGDQAESYIRKRAAVENDIMQLRLKYMPAFRRVLSGRQTALFYQIDWRLGLLVDLQLAQMPLINP
jgi:Spy/CpxP family protein refolding chaperone